MLNAKSVPSSGKRRSDPLEPGTYPVRVVQIISLGLQKQEYRGEPKDPAYELSITYEFLDEFLKDEEGNEIEDKPRWLSESFPLRSLDSDLAKSTKRYLALDPTMEHDGDWAKLGGATGMLTIVQNPSKKDSGVIYNNVANLSAMRSKEAKLAPPLVNEVVIFDFDEPNVNVFMNLPEFIQNKIRGGLEFEGSTLSEALGDAQSANSNSEGGHNQEQEKPYTGDSQSVSEDNEEDW